jgi:hypothetical protein
VLLFELILVLSTKVLCCAHGFHKAWKEISKLAKEKESDHCEKRANSDMRNVVQ